MKIKLLSLIFTAVERLGRENKLYQGGEQQSKERRCPPSVHSSAIPNMDRGITDCKLVMLTPIKTTASQASFSWKETWESYRNPLARPKNDPNFWHNRSKIKLSSQLSKIKHPHQVYCCLYITSYLPLFTWSIQISCQNTVCPQNFWFTFSTKSTTTTTNKLHWAK